MGKLNTEIVEMNKLINRSPIDSFWIYCETDITFNIIGSSSTVKIRTDDRVLSSSEATFIFGTSSEPIPIPLGTYAIGTFSTNHYLYTIPQSEFSRYILVVDTVGYITEVLNFTHSLGHFEEIDIPNISEESVEWIATEEMLRPIPKEITKGGYAIGASYSNLIRKNN